MIASDEEIKIVGRYALHGELASGGMAAVHLGRLLGPVGFARTVAIKRLHSHHARDPDFVSMFLDEARLVARIKHPNVVPTLDVVALDGELFLVMEYVHGAPVSKIMMGLSRRRERMPVNVAVAIAVGMLYGLHAAHEAKSEDGTPLSIVHRDVSPQNVIVGVDGIVRVLDFGIAKAAERLQQTEDGSFKGKLGYTPPDVLSGGRVDRRSDVWGAAVVLWEMLVGKRLFGAGDSPHALVREIVEGEIASPAARGVEISPALEDALMCGLAKRPDDRYATAREMAVALEEASPLASSRVIGEWLVNIVGEQLEQSALLVEQMERSTRALPPSLGTVRSMAESIPPPERTPGGAMPVPPPPPTPSPSRANLDGTELPAVLPISAQPIAPPRRSPVLPILVALLCLAGIATAGVLLFRRMRAPVNTTTLAAVDAGVASATPSAIPSASSASDPTAVASASASSPVASASASTSAKPPASGKPGLGRRNTPPKSCNPPYTIGPPPDFIRKPKLECLPQ